MNDLFDTLVDSIKVPETKEKYIGDDGLMHCSKCHERVEMVIKHPFTGQDRKVGVICSCRKTELKSFEETERIREREKRRMICFAETNMKNWNFENDDRKNPQISASMKRYAEQFQEFSKEGKGLLLYGTVGTGKTYYGACVANLLIDNGYDVLMTNFASITNKIQGMFEEKQQYIESLNKYDLLVIDDLGAERKTEYMQEMVFNIIDSRYRSGKPLIITTNLTAEELKKPQEIGYQRIYDRILERCIPIKVEGESRRKQKLINTFDDMKEKLGL